MPIAILFFSKYFPYISLRRSAFWKIKLTFIDVIFLTIHFTTKLFVTSISNNFQF